MYSKSVVLLLFAIVCIPLMLLVKPLCCRPKDHVHEADEIEFANIAGAEEGSLAINNADASDDLLLNRKK